MTTVHRDTVAKQMLFVFVQHVYVCAAHVASKTFQVKYMPSTCIEPKSSND